MSVRDLAKDPGKGAGSIPRPSFRWQSRLLLPIVLILATLALLVGAAWSTLFPGESVQIVPVMVKTVQGAAGATTVTASGWLEPDPFPIYATSLTSGIVEEITILEGETVKKGQVLARLVAEDAEISLCLAEAEFAAAKAEVDRAEADLLSQEERLETLIDRRRFRSAAAGRVAEFEATLAQLTATIAAEEAKLSSLGDEVERKRTLADTGAVSRGDYRRLSLARDAQVKTLEATRKQQPIVEARLSQARSDLDAAEEHLRRTINERHAVNVAKAELARTKAAQSQSVARRDEARLRLDRMEIRSPIDGIVLDRLVSPGSRLDLAGSLIHSAHVVHLYDPGSLQVRVDVPLADAGSVGLEQEAFVEVQVIPDKKFKGRVTRFLHQADIQKNTVEVKVSLDDPDPILKPEMLARVRFLAGDARVESRQRVFAPSVLLGDGSAVWVVESRNVKRGIARLRNVTLGEVRIDGWREVAAGLQPGDVLIADPPADLEDGASVIIAGEALL